VDIMDDNGSPGVLFLCCGNIKIINSGSFVLFCLK